MNDTYNAYFQATATKIRDLVECLATFLEIPFLVLETFSPELHFPGSLAAGTRACDLSPTNQTHLGEKAPGGMGGQVIRWGGPQVTAPVLTRGGKMI